MTDEIVEAIKTKIEQVGGIECVKLTSYDATVRPLKIYAEDDLYSTLFDLSLRHNIVSMHLSWDDDVIGYVLNIETDESSDGSTNITIELIQTIGEYLGRTLRGFMGQRKTIQQDLSLYKHYIRKKRRIAFVDVSDGRFDVVKTVKEHDEVKEWMKENGRYKEWHFGMVYGGGHGDLIDEHGISRKKKEYVVIQMSKRRRHYSDLVEDWRWRCLFKIADLSYPYVDVWRCPDYYERYSIFGCDIGMP